MFTALQQDQFGYNGVYTNVNASVVDLASVTDGTSNTAMVSETHSGSGLSAPIPLSAAAGTWRHLYVEAARFHAELRPRGPTGVPIAQAFVQSCQGLPGSTMAFGTLPPPNGMHLDRRQPGLVHDVGRLQPLHAA